MSDTSRPRPSSTPLLPASRTLRAAAVAILTSWLPLALLVVAGWAGSARATGGWGDALGAASLAWVTAHLGSLRVGSATLSVSPLLLVLLPLAACAGGAGVLREAVQDDRSPRTSWLGGMRGGVARLLGTYVAGYAGLGLLVALHASTMAAKPSWPSTVAGLVLVPVLGLLWALRHEVTRPTFAPSWHDQVSALLPVPVRRGLGPGARGLGVLLLAGLLPLAVTLLAHLGRVRDLTGELQAGAVGNAVLAVAQLAWLPDLAAWGLSWLAGPGFSIGVGSTYTWWTARSGLLPMVPVLGALPDNGSLPWWSCLAALVPVAIGWWAAGQAIGRLAALSSLGAKARAAATSWAVMVVGSAAALLLSSGALGGQALASVGPHVPAATAALAAETGIGVLLALGEARHRYH